MIFVLLNQLVIIKTNTLNISPDEDLMGLYMAHT